jgi:mRNA interferase HigB
MHVISRKKLRLFWALNRDAVGPLSRWYRIAKATEWRTFSEAKASFSSADQVGKFVVFNIHGNDYRLIAEINYRTQKVFVRYVLTHEDYDRGHWKTQRAP